METVLASSASSPDGRGPDEQCRAGCGSVHWHSWLPFAAQARHRL